ncbi:hypothetical protein MP228_007835 [Amoeboaphelidium protococcarum]|nr:hypothetical protein MP228_007835 [Amoeboaphelidium protococcarum]
MVVTALIVQHRFWMWVRTGKLQPRIVRLITEQVMRTGASLDTGFSNIIYLGALRSKLVSLTLECSRDCMLYKSPMLLLLTREQF